jgi:hypothetical protein
MLCALAFCAFAAQSASAKGTTAFTCSESATTKDFADEHCDREVGPPEGKWGHVEIAENTETEVEFTNAKTKNETLEATPAILKGEVALAKSEITCKKVTGTGTLKNIKDAGGVMQNEGKLIKVEYSECTVQKPAKCKVKEPIVVNATSITKETLGASGTEMGTELKPAAGAFAEITFENLGAEVCSLKGTTAKVEGTAVGTGSRGSAETVSSSGGTLLFTNSMTKETLKFGGNPAEFQNTITTTMKEVGGKPITYTTTTP